MSNSNIVNAKGAGIVSGQGINSPSVKNMQDYNGFDRSQEFHQTLRFAEVNPFFAKKFISGDKVPLRQKHNLRTYTLESPLMSKVYLNKAFYSVPLQCIYHNNFEYWFKQPVQGDDIPDNVKAGFDLRFIRGGDVSLYSYLRNNFANLSSSSSDASSVLYANNLFLLMQIYSQDGLLQKLGYGIDSDIVERLYALFAEQRGNVPTHVQIGFVDSEGTSYKMDLGTEMLQKGNDTLTFDGDLRMPLSVFRYYFFQLVNNKFNITSFYLDPAGDESFTNEFYNILDSIPGYSEELINLEKLFAYQYICSQYYSNSFVDDIYSARAWEENNLSILADAIRIDSSATAVRNLRLTYSLNGKEIRFDLICRRVWAIMTLCAANGVTYPVRLRNSFSLVLRNIFEVHDSLRMSDYFVDSKVRPLAVGDVYAAVSTQGVSAIDTNKALWIQRLLNAVNRIPQHIETYLKSMFGFEPQTREPKPFFLAKERYLIVGQEIENTSNDNQGNVVVNLRSSDNGRFQYFVECSEPCIIIGLSSFSVVYSYSKAVDEEFYEFDRLDNFNPYFQHVGDQPLKTRNINNDPTKFALSEVFSYQLRYYQYKKSINHVSGGFIKYLPTWVALFDKTYSAYSNHLNSDFIRNHNIDFDAFYKNIMGVTPNEYFHFIVDFDTECNVTSRQQKYPSLV